MRVVQEKEYVFSTDLGFMKTSVQQVEGFDIEDLVRSRAESQAIAVSLSNIATTIDPDAIKGGRTIDSAYLAGSF
jgi:hypothetical protein